MRTSDSSRTLLLAAAMACCLGGCARTSVEQRVATDYDPSVIQDRVGFWHALPGRPAVSNDEGLHGVIVFLYGDDPTRDYAERVEFARARGLVGAGFDEPGDLAMQRGTLARALVRGLSIEGGVMLALTDQHPRYATKELQYLGIMGAGTELRAISGLEMLGVMTNAQAWREAHPSAPPEPDGAAHAGGAEPDEGSRAADAAADAEGAGADGRAADGEGGDG